MIGQLPDIKMRRTLTRDAVILDETTVIVVPRYKVFGKFFGRFVISAIVCG